jgi:hypothetical protein
MPTRLQTAFNGAAVLAIAAAVGSVPARALVIEHNLAFGAFNQSPFTSGPAFSKSEALPAGLPWDITLPLPPFPPPNPFIYFSPSLKTNGFLGLEFGYAASGGRLDTSYPVNASLVLPDSAKKAASMRITANSAVDPDGFSFASVALDARRLGSLKVPIDGGRAKIAPSMTTTFPEVSAYLDFVARTSNRLEGNLTYLSPTLLNPFRQKTEKILNVDFLSFNERFSIFELGRSGISTAIPGVSLPFCTTTPCAPIDIIPGVLSTFFKYPDLKTNTRTVEGDAALRAAGTQTIANLNLDVDGLLAKVFPPLEFLESHINIKVGRVDYTILDVDAGLNLNLTQSFTLRSNVKPVLVFDQIVFKRDSSGRVLDEPLRLIEMPANGAVDLFVPLGTNAPLKITPTYVLESTLRNETSLDLTGYIDLKALSANLKLDLGFVEIDEGFGPLFKERLELGTLLHFPLVESEFPVLNAPIWTSQFTLPVTNNIFALGAAKLSVPPGTLPEGKVLYEIFDVNGTPEFPSKFPRQTLIGREVIAPTGEIVFISDTDASYTESGPGGISVTSFGRHFCVSCLSLPLDPSFLSPRTTSADNEEVYFNELFNDVVKLVFGAETEPACTSCLSDFLDDHPLRSDGSSILPTRVSLDRTDEDFLAATTLPVQGTMALLGLGLLLLSVTRGAFSPSWRSRKSDSL